MPDSNEYEANQKKLKGYQAESADVAPKASRILSDKRVSQLVTFDPGSGKYVPAIPAPSWKDTTGTGNSLSRSYVAPEERQGPPVPQTRSTGAPIQDEPMAPMIQAPRQGQATAPASAPKYEPQFYNRVNQLIGSGMNPAAAKAQALQERAYY
jgi:hypothetical protein